MLKLISKVVMWGSNKSVYVFLLLFFFREKHDRGQTVDKPWTNRGTTYRIVVERPRIVVEQPRIVVDTPKRNALKVFHIYQCIFWDGLWTACQSWKQHLISLIYVYTLFHISTPKPAVQLLPTSHPGMVFWNSMIKSNSIDCSSKWCIEWNMS